MLYFNLQLFAEEAAATMDVSAGGQSEASTSTETTANTGAVGQSAATPTAATQNAGEEREVLYTTKRGTKIYRETPKAAAPTQVQDAAEPQDFKTLIEGKYKNEATAYFQGLLNKRTRKNVETMDAIQPILDIAAKRYNVEATDYKTIAEKLATDAAYLDDEAAEKGVSVETMQHIKELEFRDAQEKQAAEKAKLQESFDKFAKQSNDLQSLYPNYNPSNELKNEDFAKMVHSGIDAKTAYQAIHFDELIESKVNAAVQEAVGKTMNSVRAGSARPNENGLANPVGTVMEANLHDKAYRDYLKAKVARGEKVVL